MHLNYANKPSGSKEVTSDHECVRKVISPDESPDRFPDPRRALIGGACRLWQWAPLAQRHIKGEASRGTGTNVPRVHSAPTNPNPKTDQKSR
jgi:hypothetical protein